jgi:bifunctional non-homologous end joining protein LigD
MSLTPMLAQDTPALPEGRGWRYEPKYDGIRLLSVVNGGRARLLSRDGNDKTRQFPEVAAALEALHRTTGCNFVLDGELVSASGDGYAGFQALASRINLRKKHRTQLLAELQPAALVAFDVLVIDAAVLTSCPLDERRQALVRLLSGRTGPNLRIARHSRSGQRMLAVAVGRNLEGVVAKRADSPYLPNQRGPHWLKYKLTRRQEFVVAGYTLSERREPFGALVLGYYEAGKLKYAGAVGSGFSRDALATCHRRLQELEPAFCPFELVPDLREAVRWTRPEAVVEVTFEQWTVEGRVRNPRFVGVRIDKPAREVVREQ